MTNPLSGTVRRIDPKTNTVVATIRTGFFPHGVTVADDAVWVTLAGSGYPFSP